jgi:hypothetical protein
MRAVIASSPEFGVVPVKLAAIMCWSRRRRSRAISPLTRRGKRLKPVISWFTVAEAGSVRKGRALAWKRQEVSSCGAVRAGETRGFQASVWKATRRAISPSMRSRHHRMVHLPLQRRLTTTSPPFSTAPLPIRSPAARRSQCAPQ